MPTTGGGRRTAGARWRPRPLRAPGRACRDPGARVGGEAAGRRPCRARPGVGPGLVAALASLAAAAPPGEPLRLEELPAPASKALAQLLVDGEPLPADEVERLLQGTHEPAAPEPPATPARPWSGVPTPRELRLEELPVPAHAIAEPPEVGPLRVVRRQPDGEARRTAEVAVTFSQPMDTRATPLRVSPEVAGSFRWLRGGHVLVFSPSEGLPPARRFDVSVPAGARAASGERLAAEERFVFVTAPPADVSYLPLGRGRDLGRRPVVLVSTNDELDWEDVAPLVSFRASGRSWPVRRVTEAELDAEAPASPVRDGHRARSMFAVRPAGELPARVKAQLCVAAPGPAPGKRLPWSDCFSFQTDEPAPPLDRDAAPRAQRAPAGRDAAPAQGVPTAPAPPPPAFWLPGDGELVVLPPPASELVVVSSGLEELRIRVHAVTPRDWPAYVAGIEATIGADRALVEPPGRQVLDATVRVRAPAGGLARTPVVLAPALREGRGHAVVTVEAGVDPAARRIGRTWVQVTDLAIEVWPAADTMRVLATSVATGRAIAGVAVALAPDGAEAVTGADGSVVLPLPGSARFDRIVRAARLGDVAFAPAGLPGQRQETWARQERPPGVTWHLFRDAAYHLTGGSLRVRGWVRLEPGSSAGRRPGAALGEVAWRLDAPAHDEVAQGVLPVSAAGTFDLAIELPPTLEPGTAELVFAARGRGLPDASAHVLPVFVHRYEPDPIGIELAAAPPVRPGGAVEVEVATRDATGAGVPVRRVDWSVSASCRATGPAALARRRTSTSAEGRARLKLHVEAPCDRARSGAHVYAVASWPDGPSDKMNVALEAGAGPAGSGTTAGEPPPSLGVELEVPPSALAGAELDAAVRVRMPDGSPAAGAEVAVSAAHPALASARGEDFVEAWSPHLAPGRAPVRLRDRLEGRAPADPAELERAARHDEARARARRPPASPPPRPAARRPASEVDGGRAYRDGSRMPIRERLGSTPVSFATAVTDAAGFARVRLVAPAHGRAVRVRALAVRDGRAEGAGADIPLRPGRLVPPPPLGTLRPADRFLVPLRLVNASPAPLVMRVAVRARGLSLPEGAGRRVTVPAESVVDVRLPAVAGAPGEASLELVAMEGSTVERASLHLTVAPAERAVRAAVVSVGKEGVSIRPGESGAAGEPLEVTVGEVSALELLDQVPEDRLPGCIDQVAARLLARATLAPGLGGPTGHAGRAAAADAAALALATERVAQPAGCAPRADPPQLLAAAEALIAAGAAGIRVNPRALSSLVANARALGTTGEHFPRDGRPSEPRTIVARALHVLHRAGEDDWLRAAQRLRDAEPRGLTTAELGWLLPVLGAGPGDRRHTGAVTKELERRVRPAGGGGVHLPDRAAAPTAARDEPGPVDHRADAVVLAALAETGRAPALAAALREHLRQVRASSGWGIPEERALAISALAAPGAKSPPGRGPAADVWAGDRRVETVRPGAAPLWVDLAAHGATELRLAADGPTGVRVAGRGDAAVAAGAVAVERSYEAVRDPEDVRREPDGSWRIRAGALVRVRLDVVASTDAGAAAIVEEPPAGLVPVEASEGASIRGGRVEAVLPALAAGLRSVGYTARAAARGDFRAAPATVRGSSPGQDADSGTDRVRVF